MKLVNGMFFAFIIITVICSFGSIAHDSRHFKAGIKEYTLGKSLA